MIAGYSSRSAVFYFSKFMIENRECHKGSRPHFSFYVECRPNLLFFISFFSQRQTDNMPYRGRNKHLHRLLARKVVQ